MKIHAGKRLLAVLKADKKRQLTSDLSVARQELQNAEKHMSDAKTPDQKAKAKTSVDFHRDHITHLEKQLSDSRQQ